MFIQNKWINNLYGATITLCLMAVTCYPDFWTMKTEMGRTMQVLEAVFSVNVTRLERGKRWNFRNIATDDSANLLLWDFFIPLIERSSIALAGCLCSALLGNSFGRRTTLMIISFVTVLIYVGKIITESTVLKLLGSFTTLGTMNVVITYMSEISPCESRGVYIVLPSSMALFRYLYDQYLENEKYYISVALLCITPVSIFVFCEESPYYHLIQNQPGMAFKQLCAFRQGDVNVDKEINEMIDDVNELTYLTVRDLKYTVKMAMGLIFLEWFSAANVAVLIGSWIYKSFQEHTDYLPNVLSLIILIAQVLSVFVVERFERKNLLITSIIGMIFFQSIWCIRFGFTVLSEENFKYISLVLFVIFIVFFYLGIGSLIWVILAEIYPSNKKIWYLGISIYMVFYCSFVFVFPFLYLLAFVFSYAPVGGIIGLIGCWMVVFYFLVFRNTVIETRQKSFWKIQAELYHNY